MSSPIFAPGNIVVAAPGTKYDAERITAEYVYTTTEVAVDPATGSVTATPRAETYVFTTERRVPRVGVMIVGLGGNNGTTVAASILAHKHGLTWETKAGVQRPDYLGSITQASTVRLGTSGGRDVYVPFSSLLPCVHPTDLVVGGWDISSMPLDAAMTRAEVLDIDLQRKLRPLLAGIVPLPSCYYPDWIAANQADRADNVLPGGDKAKAEHVATLRRNIRDFKAANGLDKVVVLWSANTEVMAEVRTGLNTTADELLAAIERSDPGVSQSTVFAVAAALEGCTFINGSPQNALVPGAVDLAIRQGTLVGGSDFKSGQTKIKSVLVDFLVSAGIKPTSIVSYNHLGNNDGKNLSAPSCFRSKEITKTDVVTDMVASNPLLYPDGTEPDHCVVIKYVPAVGDSKRAMDEYSSRIFMGGTNTIVLHNTCEDSLLAAPLILDLVVIAELCERIKIRRADEPQEAAQGFHSVLSLLSYLLKAPMVPEGTPVVNALFRQREALLNVMRACIGLPPENHMLLEHRLRDAGAGGMRKAAAAGGDAHSHYSAAAPATASTAGTA